MLHAGAARYEIKISCQPHYLHQVHAWVRLHTAHWRVNYPPRQVNNIYFDTGDNKSLNDNLCGVSMRRKLRLRWYGPSLKTVTKARLELKCKEGWVGWKEVYSLAPLTLDLCHQSWPELRQTLRAAADERADLWMAQFACPVLINHYWRAYYVTSDGTLRLTVDADLCTYDQRYSAYPNLRRRAPVADRVIIEFKADRQHYPRLINALRGFPIRIDRFSKYVRGMLAGPDFDGIELL